MGIHRIGAFALAVAAAGCGSPKDDGALNAQFEAIVRQRASLEFPCSGALVVEELGGYAYRASGCGAYATYECEYSSTQGQNGSNDNHSIYVCERAAHDDPTRLPIVADAGAE